MSDRRYERGPRDERPVGREPSFSEQIDVAVRRLVTAIVAAGGLIGLGAYAGGGGGEAPDYQIVATESRVYRLNTDSGTVIACEGEVCARVLRRGQDLEDSLPERPAIPAPAVAPAQTPAPTAGPAAR